MVRKREWRAITAWGIGFFEVVGWPKNDCAATRKKAQTNKLIIIIDVFTVSPPSFFISVLSLKFLITSSAHANGALYLRFPAAQPIPLGRRPLFRTMLSQEFDRIVFLQLDGHHERCFSFIILDV